MLFILADTVLQFQLLYISNTTLFLFYAYQTFLSSAYPFDCRKGSSVMTNDKNDMLRDVSSSETNIVVFIVCCYDNVKAKW